jgi:hypothetical protein
MKEKKAPARQQDIKKAARDKLFCIIAELFVIL